MQWLRTLAATAPVPLLAAPLLACLLIAALLGVPAAAQTDIAGPDASCPSEPSRTGVIAEVIDGDTVRLADGAVVRLAAISAPKRPLGGATDWPLAEAAQSALDDLVGGRSVSLATIDEAPDRYGRFQADLSLDGGLWVQAAMLQRGMARLTGQATDSECFSSLLRAEAAARAAGRGLWRTEEYAIKTADDPSLPDRKGLYEIVEGRVVSVGHGRRMIFLDFGSDYRRDFTIMVTPALAKRLAEAGVSVDQLEGRRVRVRGVIEESGGPAIRISHPAELELLDD